MQYVVWGAAALPDSASNAMSPLAAGETLVFEGPWPFNATALGFLATDASLDSLKGRASGPAGGFAVEGIERPGDGGAFVIAAHKMLDPAGFKPYADAIPDMLKSFGVRSLARGGKVTPLAPGFVPDRGVVLEFSSADAAVDFYTSDVYRPLLDLRLRTTDPRFALLSRDGRISAETKRRLEDFLQRRRN